MRLYCPFFIISQVTQTEPKIAPIPYIESQLNSRPIIVQYCKFTIRFVLFLTFSEKELMLLSLVSSLSFTINSDHLYSKPDLAR